MITYQRPNAILIIAVTGFLVARIVPHPFDTVAHAVGVVALSGWAYDEVRYGDSPFRRALGLVISLYLVISVALHLSTY